MVEAFSRREGFLLCSQPFATVGMFSNVDKVRAVGGSFWKIFILDGSLKCQIRVK